MKIVGHADYQTMEEEESLNAAIDQLVDLKREISGVLEQIHDPDCQLLLDQRYTEQPLFLV